MELNDNELIELKNLIKCSIYYGYKTNENTVNLAQKLIERKSLEKLEENNIGISLI